MDHYYLLQEDRLCIKINTEKNPEVSTREYSKTLLNTELLLKLKRPKSIRQGKVVTIAIIEDYLQTDSSGLVNVEKTVKVLNKCKKIRVEVVPIG
ncbi:hypothetical protein FLK61_38475 [Paenalkalicoccus suaedae]|uniref:Uncharacterized protein n=1 Tax=Paenalkalicoccus suaedae TaxID=2592382 RepID=A0A859FI59_9BACI|nr:hypothetical protein [Paenalkalicoccus suaedae]QKS72510.1 hypothetical protein FLK61_38475 [Paenalkalicoccus suaedae]